MKNQLCARSLRAARSHYNRWMKARQNHRVASRQVTSADIQAYRRYLASYQRQNSVG